MCMLVFIILVVVFLGGCFYVEDVLVFCWIVDFLVIEGVYIYIFYYFDGWVFDCFIWCGEIEWNGWVYVFNVEEFFYQDMCLCELFFGIYVGQKCLDEYFFFGLVWVYLDGLIIYYNLFCFDFFDVVC